MMNEQKNGIVNENAANLSSVPSSVSVSNFQCKHNWYNFVPIQDKCNENSFAFRLIYRRHSSVQITVLSTKTAGTPYRSAS